MARKHQRSAIVRNQELIWKQPAAVRAAFTFRHMNDFISLPRAWLEPEITGQPDFLRAVVYLAREISDHATVCFSSGDAQRMFGMSPRRYRTFMQIITANKHTDKQTTNKTTNITFDYQPLAVTRRQARRQTTDKQKNAKFTPPTDEDVAAYVSEKGYHFDPAQFVSFYQSKGWRVGNEPMKDWRAACRTWEQRWKEKYGEQFHNQLALSASTDTPASRKAQRQRGLSLACEIVSRSENLLNLYNDGGEHTLPGEN